MFKKNLKLIATALSLALITSIASSLTNAINTTSMATQIPLPSRDELIRTIFDPTPLLTASGENIIFDPDKMIFLSTLGGTFAFVPLHPAYQQRLIELYKAWQEFGDIAVPIGGLYVIEPMRVVKGLYNESPEFSLPKGAYVLEFAPVDPKVGSIKIAIVDKDGQTVGYVSGEIRLMPQYQPLNDRPFIQVKQVGDLKLAEIEIPWLLPSTINNLQSMNLDSVASGPITDFLTGFGAGLALVALFFL